MTIQPDEEELHVIPTAGAPGTAGAGFRVIDRTGATDEEFRARVAVFDAAEEPEEVVVEKLHTTIAFLRGELATSIEASGAWRSRLEAVEALADELDANINWREWGIGNRIRRALDAS